LLRVACGPSEPGPIQSSSGTPETRAAALDAAKASIGAGATHVILGMPAPLGPAGLDEVVRDCLLPLREATA
jgi:hypothetical protein